MDNFERRDPKKIFQQIKDIINPFGLKRLCIIFLIILIINVVIAYLVGVFPNSAKSWRLGGFALLCISITYFLLLVFFEIDEVSNSDIKKIEDIMGAETPGKVLKYSDDPDKVDCIRRLRKYILIVLFCWISFSFFVAEISIPNYVKKSGLVQGGNTGIQMKIGILEISTKSNNEVYKENYEIKNLESVNLQTPWGIKRLAKIVGNSAYFVAVSMATIGFGDVAPGVDAFWGRTAGLSIALYVIIMLPLLGYALLEQKNYKTQETKITATRIKDAVQ